MVRSWVPKWDSAAPISLETTLNTILLINTTTPDLNSTVATLATTSVLLLLAERNPINLQLLSIRFIRFLNIPSNFHESLYSSSHPSHVKSSIPYSQFLRLRRLYGENSNFPLKSDDFFDTRGYPASVVRAGHHSAQLIDRQSELQPSQKETSISTSRPRSNYKIHHYKEF